MSKDHTRTVRIRKFGKVAPVELELVSTTALEKILKTEGDKTRSDILKLAAGRKDGVLARAAATGHFRILSDADLKKAAELSLASAQFLRKVMKPAIKKDKFGGFNPYDNN